MMIVAGVVVIPVVMVVLIVMPIIVVVVLMLTVVPVIAVMVLVLVAVVGIVVVVVVLAIMAVVTVVVIVVAVLARCRWRLLSRRVLNEWGSDRHGDRGGQQQAPQWKCFLVHSASLIGQMNVGYRLWLRRPASALLKM